jgi:CBS domain-containing protein
MTEEPKEPREEFFMAIAGPLSSAFLAVVFMLAAYAGAQADWPPTVNATLKWLGYINFILAVFNLVPGFPLDGGRVFRSILWYLKQNLHWATRVASATGAGIGAGLTFLGFLSLFLFNPIGGMWWILIGLFLQNAAKQSYRQLLLREALSGEPVKRYMNPEPVAVRPDTTVMSLVEDYIYRYHLPMFPVVSEGRLAGCVSTRDVQKVPRAEWSARTVASIVSQCSPQTVVGPDQDALAALSLMSRGNLPSLLVVDGDRLAGVVSAADLLRFLALKLELEGEERPVNPPAR